MRHMTAMKITGLVIASGFALASTATAQTAPAPSLESLRAAYSNGVVKINADIQKQRDDALLQYGKNLGAVLASLKKMGDIDGYMVVEQEVKRLKSEKIPPLGDPNALFAKEVALCQKQESSADTDLARRKADLLKRYVSALGSLVKELMAKDKFAEAKTVGDEKKTMEFMLAETELTLPKDESTSMKAASDNVVAKKPTLSTTKKVYSYEGGELLGGDGGSHGEDFKGEGAVLVGLEVTTFYHEHFKTKNIGSIQPIYRMPDGSIWTDKVYGQKQGDALTLQAKDGYVVYRVDGYADGPIHGFKIVFAEMKDINGSLSGAKTYDSDFVGEKVGTHKILGKNGKPAVGIFFQAGAYLNGFGLFTHKMK